MKIAVKMLGCPKNDVDAEVMIYLLKEAGHEITTDPAQAEAIIVNTCGFIKDAKDESVDAILEMAQYKKDGRCRRLIVTGCLSQRYNKKLFDALPEVDLMIGVNDYDRIVSLVEGTVADGRVLMCNQDPSSPFIPGRVVSTPKHYAYLKIAEGCSNRCAYCAIPDIRGPYRSRGEKSILDEAAILAQQGVLELVLVAQDTTRYGMDLGDGCAITGLLEKLTKVDGIARVRLLYCYPELITDELLELVSGNDRICSYLDIPLQHIDDGILKAMNRRSDERQIRNLIEKIRSRYEIALRTTFIVGFPSEGEAEFYKLLDFVKEARFDNMGAFIFSPEEGTPAYRMKPRVLAKAAKARHHEIMMAQQAISGEILSSKVGSTCSAIADSMTDGLLVCRSCGQAPDIDGVIYVDGSDVSNVGKILNIKITGASEYDLRGIVL